MKQLIALALLACAGTGFGQAIKVSNMGGYGVDSAFNHLYTHRTERTFTGTVTGKIKASPMNGMTEGESILVRVSKRGVISVDMGPTWYLQNQAVKINMGDKVKVTGSQVRVGRQNLVLARQLRKGKYILTLRDYSGVPFWDDRRQRTVRVTTNTDQNSNAPIEGQVLEPKVVTINGVPYAGYVIRTGNGNVNVVTAPQWYEQQQVTPIQVGSSVQVVPWGASYTVGGFGPVINAGVVTVGGNSLTYRNPDGSPFWGH